MSNTGKDFDYLLREAINTIKASIDQIYYGILDFLDEDEKADFLEYLKTQSDSFQDVLYKSIVQKAKDIDTLNEKLVSSNRELTRLKDSLEEKVEQRTRQIRMTQDVTIFSLARLAESRDNETGEHLDRIRHLSLALSKAVASKEKYSEIINKSFLYNIFHSSPLHDIGKVGISDTILLKPAKLTVDEFDIMKKHTLIGGKTLEDAEKQLLKKSKAEISFLSMGKAIAYYHHEKWDGSGYPFGLSEEKIPLVARIVAIVDVYDALVSKRVYKEAFSHKDSIEIIQGDRGKHFDPELVDIFLSIEDVFHRITQKK